MMDRILFAYASNRKIEHWRRAVVVNDDADRHPTSLPPKPSRREKKSGWRTEASTVPSRVWLPKVCSAKSKRDFIQKYHNALPMTWHIPEMKDAPLCHKCHATDALQSRTKMQYYRFRLRPYRTSSKQPCPKCGRKACFTPYIDAENSIMFPSWIKLPTALI